ncbi:DEAD/DEAH box helicase [Corynebacterium diphtheriae]|uniref:DEAD/DEAH box helicase n=1 Tax=Corynebacterium diphtheriae TaxID=1717 RepID=UPI0008FB2595|nr:DEAD/DEAH box helicase family protein [Corynebacterium diphtheriae]MBG9336350.1 DEAD/DEAH box helicase family protein [Corynebacterium diphtheriae bv. gravis]OIS20954.1 restriction endonuclease [Corynebacterium diphtheriae]RLP13556.1 restriction endonuclease [Corynebacterium diphtheriae]CAB0732496.1 DNA restriction-modification system, restriction enzyme [Corynebacterium diphtheriae]CAB0931579.1 DNA restriction-modification system, restriction enzyme [Corynebacterium diphtheriae]
MATRLNISFDSDVLESISSEFDLRAPNKEALRQLVFTLDGDYEPSIMQVLNLATGVGKTYLMAAFVEYLRRQGVGNVVIVTPGKTVQAKTVQNFTPGSPRYITGSVVPPEVVTPQDYSAWVARQNGAAQLSFGHEVPILAFIFNIQQLIAPKSTEGDTHGNTQDAMRRKPRRFDENAGVLFDYLKGLDDLVVIADESHLYGSSAIAFNAALKELDPAATIGLTASVDKKSDHVIYHYPLFRAIQDKYVKAPVLAFRKTGYGTDEASEEQQLRDALQLRSIKQVYYDSFAASENRKHVNAVVFVVCSDVDHATQVTELLRSPEYLGNDDAVLQVDSKHEDELTQRRLNELDRPHSSVLAVVSVNKLKEGWDVRNIAVVVTLRAMASEVLTQQTMGRGLRLPFGHYTGVWQIDQLDIIAHQSFTELLNAENVLNQFGLEEAVTDLDKAQVEAAILKAAETATSLTDTDVIQPGDVAPHEAGVWPIGDSSNSDDSQAGIVPVGGENSTRTPSVGVREITDPAPEGGTKWELVSIERNPAFADVTYQFPVTTMTVQQPSIDLSEIGDDTIEQAARRVTSAGDVLLRKEIIAVLGKKLRAEDRESAEVDSVHVDEDDAKNALVKLVLNMSLVPKTEQTARYVAAFLVPKFMQSVMFSGWTVKSLDSARTELLKLIQNYTVETLRSTREVPSIHPKPMPSNGYTLPLGQKVHDQIETREQFVRSQVYGGWFKSLFAEESFDSFTGEYQLARLLNISPGIVWWHRLHPQDQAFVFYNAKDRYFPDFVAMDVNGVHWIIEGKSERGRDDAQVQAKRKAAEALVRRLVAEDAYADQLWGYLIAYEQDIARADSWEDLKAFASPVNNAL